MKKASVHLIYNAIILALLIYMTRLGAGNDPSSERDAPASNADRAAQVTESRLANDDVIRQPSTQQNNQNEQSELREQVSRQAQHIESLQARINALHDAQTDSFDNHPTEQQQAVDVEEQFHRLRAQQEAERDDAFANATQTAQSDEAQQRLETSIYNLDNSPRFESLDVECRGVYCNIEVSFENQGDARDFVSYQGRRIFEQADIRTHMTRAETRGGRVMIKADLAPLEEE